MNLIEIRGLCKNFETFKLQNVDITLEEGYIMGFIGRNGAGKSTTIKTTLNLMNSDGGTVKLCGLEMPKDEIEIKNQVGYVLGGVDFYPEAKIGVYTAMKDLLPEKTILVTNSSTMLPSTFAEYTGRPAKYCALHFANTIWKNNTAEVMGHPGTDQDIYNEVVKFASEIGMIPLQLHKEQPGYILNSMLVPFLDSAEKLWANEVADPQTIDLTWKLATGAPKGPFEIIDIVGLDTVYAINQMKPDAKVEGTLTNKIGKLVREKLDKGESGINAGKGFYDYTKK